MVDAQWPGRTCADSNGDGTADDWHDCSAHANDLDGSPEGIMCAADPCTDTECCTVAPHAGGDIDRVDAGFRHGSSVEHGHELGHVDVLGGEAAP